MLLTQAGHADRTSLPQTPSTIRLGSRCVARETRQWTHSLPRLLRYGVVGSVATGVHYALLVLAIAAGLGPVRASTLGAILGAVTHYAFSSRFVFHQRLAIPTLAAFVCVALVGVAANAILLSLLHERLRLPLIMAQPMATIGCFLISYRLNSVWTFRVREPGHVRGGSNRADP